MGNDDFWHRGDRVWDAATPCQDFGETRPRLALINSRDRHLARSVSKRAALAATSAPTSTLRLMA